MTSIVFTQFSDDLPVDINKEYYISPLTRDTGLQEIHKLCLFPEKLREYLRSQSHIGNLNAITTLKLTPLMIAVRNGVTDSVKLLLQSSVNVNLQNINGWSALMIACRGCNKDSNIECVKLLLQNSSDINLQNDNGVSALMFSCKNYNIDSSIECVKLLLEHSSELNLQNIYGYTALMTLCNKYTFDKDNKCIKLLLDHYELTSQEIDLESLTNYKLITKELYPVFLPYLLKIKDLNKLQVLPLDLLVEIIKIKNNIITQINKLKQFDLNSIILNEIQKCCL